MPDIVVHDATVLTVDDRNRLFERGTLVIEDGELAAVRATEDGDTDIDADRVVDGEGRLAMPGLVNAHAHLELTALLGAFSELDVEGLLGTMTALAQGLGEGEYGYLADAGCDLAALNFLRGGVTTVNAMDARPERSAEAFGRAGLRGVFGPWLSDLFWDVPVDEQFERARSFVESYHGSYGGRVRASVCPHDDWSCSRSLWERAAALAAEYPELPVHTHLLELEAGNTMARANDAGDSLALLEEVGLLDERLVAAHFRVAGERDVERVAESGAAVAHCPSVFCYWSPDGDLPWTPVPELRDAGATVGLGLDDHYWHDSYDLFGEARQTRLAANLSFGANRLGSMELVRMLTVEGARALGLGDEIGSLEPGKRADVILLDVSKPKFAPRTNVPALVANTATDDDVETVLVDGELLMHEGEVLTMDGEAVQARAGEGVDRFAAESGWEFGPGRPDPPGSLRTAADLPKRGPARLLARLGRQRIEDALGR